MIIVKMYSNKNSRYSFSSMEERLQRQKAMKLHLPRYRQMFSGQCCDTPQHKKINTVIMVDPEGHSFTFSKICCDEFRDKLMALYNKQSVKAKTA